jgi:hypothetical protein
MRPMIFALILTVLSPVALPAQEPANPSIEAIIKNQIAAFQADDFVRAFTFASPDIKNIFGTAQNFGVMVQRGYPMVHHPKSVRMLDLREVNGRYWQRVMIVDNAGATHMLGYEMIETSEGWQINAVQILPQSGVGV